jgi:hypothetical protein
MSTSKRKRLVIDASVALKAGGGDAPKPTSVACRSFLTTMLELGHQLVWTQELAEEWNRHAARFAKTWRKSMVARGRVVPIAAELSVELRSKILASTTFANQKEALAKDLHLLAAAMASDKLVVSLDETVRKLFSMASKQVGQLREVAWFDPDSQGETASCKWLKDSCPAKPWLLSPPIER